MDSRKNAMHVRRATITDPGRIPSTTGLLPAALVTLTALVVCGGAAADEVDYARDVKPVLRQRCYSCHGALKQEAGLRLDTGELIRRGGDDGAVVIAKETDQSSLLERIAATDESERMPPEGKPLTADEIRRIKAWIAAGARSPADERPEADPRKHWAFQPPIRPPVPSVADTTWVRNPVDAFIAARREQRGLTPLAEADKSTLLRRLYLDLIGLPPTRRQRARFLNDDSPNAYEREVDRLLNSPQYGERWGRHWMDVWRYSDWYGRRRVPDCLNSYGQIWRWRDWIVRSLNDDKGYDQMVREMLAADELAPDDLDNVVATGFVVRNFYRWNYNTWMKDAVEHTGKAFLGLTLNCCHCHDHKYDPIAHEEYFRFRAFFEPIEIRHDPVAGEPDPGPYPKYSYGKAYKPITSGLVRIMDEKLDAETFVYSGGEARNVIPGRPPVEPGAPAILGGDKLTVEPIELPPASWYPGLRPYIRRAALAPAEADLAKQRAIFSKAKQLVATAADNGAAREAAGWTYLVDQANLTRAEAAVAAVKARILADQIRYEGRAGDPDAAARAASRAERRIPLEAARVELYWAQRGLAAEQRKPIGKQVAAEVEKWQAKVASANAAVAQAEKELAVKSTKYKPFSVQYPERSTGRRAALARWITRRDNPLAARVAVNHIWLRHFGRALVETTENFGRNGARPSHPQLLDWLAVELMDSQWRMKAIHRLLVTSNTYRMASSPVGITKDRPSAAAIAASRAADPDNRMYWRFNAARMQAEVLRDTVLHVSGSLDRSLGGKEIAQNLGLTLPRRSLYFEHHGEGRMEFLDLFDAADPCDAYRRRSSVRPQQALALANSELTLRESRKLARRLADELSGDRGTFISAAFTQVLGREATAAEAAATAAFLKRQTRLFESADPKQLLPQKGEAVPPATDPQQRARESFVHALFNHHDFLTIR